MNFKKISLEDIEIIKPYIESYKTNFCDYTLCSIFMWRDLFSYEYSICKETLFIRRTSVLDDNKKVYLFPIGPLSIDEKISILKNITEDITLTVLNKEDIEYLSNNYRISQVSLNGYSDYIYSHNDLSLLTGKKYHKKRNKVNKFKKNYLDFTYESLTLDNIEKCIDFLIKIKQYNLKDNEIYFSEINSSIELLKNHKSFSLLGGIIKLDEKIIALTIAEKINDTLFIHIEKALREYDGSFEMINYLFLNHNFSILVNREEDMGDLGLIQAKQSYYPIELLEKTEISLHFSW